MQDLKNESLYVLDFDGVVCDSTLECLVTSWNAWQEIDGKKIKKFSEKQFSKNQIKEFYRLRPYVKGAGEYFTIYQAKKKNIVIDNDHKFRELSLFWKSEITEYKNLFYRERDLLRDADLENWVNLHFIYSEVIKFLRDKLPLKQIYVATLKDGKSVRNILEKQKIFLDKSLLFDESKISSKLEALDIISTETNTEKRDVIFVDDNLNHLVDPNNRGYKVFLAAWSNTPMDFIVGAKKSNISILNHQEDIKELLYLD